MQNLYRSRIIDSRIYVLCNDKKKCSMFDVFMDIRDVKIKNEASHSYPNIHIHAQLYGHLIQITKNRNLID